MYSEVGPGQAGGGLLGPFHGANRAGVEVFRKARGIPFPR